ncbi:hypothetical protein I79_019799 [Cricetulus griseus]|uniref:Uncharacterized protein n=1 Tax=Cricetulus griseus TaxID=10029 RepID=G3I8D5_CRIGR|nr:hypothetical protein I79_019799 [Cricetulus griseus]
MACLVRHTSLLASCLPLKKICKDWPIDSWYSTALYLISRIVTTTTKLITKV